MSAPILEYAPSSVEHLDQLSQADLLQLREQIDAELATLDTEFNDYFKKLEESNDPQLAILEQLESDQTSNKNKSDETSPFDYMIEQGDGLLSPEVIGFFEQIRSLDAKEEKIVAQLDERFAPALMQYARDEALEVIANLDYVEAGKHKKGKSPELPDGDGITLRSYEQALPYPDEVIAKLHDIAYDEHANLNYRYAELQVDEIERCKDIFERWGVGTKKSWAKSVHDYTELERAEELNARYRNGYHFETSPIAAESIPHIPMHEWAVDLPDDEIAKYYEHLASIDIDKELERVTINGTELLPFDFSDKELREYIRTHIPAIALEGLNDIVFRNSTEEEKEYYRKSNIFDGEAMGAGHHSHDLKENHAQIVIFLDPFQKLHDKWKQAHPDSQDVESWVKSEVMSTIAHELGHALHQTLPVSILNEWDNVASSDNVEVSNYVSEMNKHEHANRFKEDFAESFELYVNRPYELRNKSDKRFETLQAMVTKLKK